MINQTLTPRSRAGWFAALAALTVLIPNAFSKVFYTQEAAFEEYYPGLRIEKVVHFLTEEEQKSLEQEIKGRVNPVIHSYQLFRENELVVTVYFDKHLVRTLPETLMISIQPNQTVGTVRMMVFREPREYIPRGRWYEQFSNEPLHDNLALHHNIDGVTGATLTARATVGAVRRVLTLHEFFIPQAEKTP